jgi:3-methyladenine DNA glycosylase AlkD
MLKQIISDLHFLKNAQKAQILQGFFKTKKGQYGEGDIFIGVTIPQIRILVQKYYLTAGEAEIKALLNSPIHEERLLATLLMVKKFAVAKNNIEREKVFDFYLNHINFINNWDLVDVSCHKIIGQFLIENPDKKYLLYEFARSDSLWVRRIAVVSNWLAIKQGNFADIISISKMLLDDQHNLIHKAIGWMLREMGKVDQKTLIDFLNENAGRMPRIMLSYAIEKFPKDEQNKFRQIKRK